MMTCFLILLCTFSILQRNTIFLYDRIVLDLIMKFYIFNLILSSWTCIGIIAMFSRIFSTLKLVCSRFTLIWCSKFIRNVSSVSLLSSLMFIRLFSSIPIDRHYSSYGSSSLAVSSNVLTLDSYISKSVNFKWLGVSSSSFPSYSSLRRRSLCQFSSLSVYASLWPW